MADFKLAMEDIGESINEKEFYKMASAWDPQNTGMMDFKSF